jgi:aspartate carbamoyltransferase regulatory subunit
LARQRKQDISNLQYRLKFRIPENKQEEVIGKVQITLKQEKVQPVVLDFREDPHKVKQLKVNGRPDSIRISNEHIVVGTDYLKKGAVIDHIPSEKLFTVVQLLGVEQMTSNITIGFNLDSKKLGKKGIIKIADKFFCDEEINRISVVAPHVKLNIIRDYEVVEKKEVKMPDELRGIVKCANPKCITNNEPMATIFHVIDKDNCIVKCHYCEKEQKREEITIL